MKSLFCTLAMTALLFGCAKKMTPSAEPVVINTVKPPEATPKEAIKQMETAEVSNGKALYTTKCTRCHGPMNVGNWTVQEWIPILDRMAPKAKLDATEKANVTAYVNFYAKTGS